jgi:hypothetical protein
LSQTHPQGFECFAPGTRIRGQLGVTEKEKSGR